MGAHIVNADILRKLTEAAAPLTTAELAERLRTDKTKTLSGRLAKLHAYGKIDREWRKDFPEKGGHRRFCVWATP